MGTDRDATLGRIAREHGTPCFAYFMDDVTARVTSVRDHFGGRFQISYAMKSNPNPGLLSRMRHHCDCLDISSGGELQRALRAGWDAGQISFTGPAKRRAELEAAVEHRIGEVVVESVAEALALDASARRGGVCQPILVRVAPQRVPKGFGVNMAGKPTQFGIDEEEMDAAFTTLRDCSGLSVEGLHIYSGTQCLDAASIAENYAIFVEIFRGVCARHDLTPRKLIFGSGIGIPYHENNQPVDLGALATPVNTLLDDLRGDARFADTAFVLETGRYLVGEAGVYLTRVLYRKESRGSIICICDGGMNHHLGACGHLGGVLQRNYPIFKVGSTPGETTETVDLVGPLCTSIDTLGQRVALPAPRVGDVIGIGCSGAYGVSASPVDFISHARPAEHLVDGEGEEAVICDVGRRAASLEECG